MKRILIRVSILGATLAALFTGWACHTAAPGSGGQPSGAIPAAPVPLGGAYQYVLPPGPAGYIPQSAGPGQPAPWVPAAFGQASAIYGDGSSGSFTADGTDAGAIPACLSLTGAATYSQVADCYFSTLTINVSETIYGAGFRLFVNGTLTNNGTYSVDGSPGDAGNGSPALGGGAGETTTARLMGGANAGSNNGDSVTNSLGGAGGCSSFGNVGGAATAPAAYYGSPGDLLTAINGYLASGSTAHTAIVGITGGGGGATLAGASGGGGGGVAIVAAYALAGNGVFGARGGNGYPMVSPGVSCYATVCYSGGGGGGVLVLVTHTSTWTGSTYVDGGGWCGLTCAGTDAAAPCNSGGPAQAGSPGTIRQFTF